MPSSPPSSLYPRPQMSQCVKSGASELSCSSLINILYRGGMSGKGRLSIRNENTNAGAVPELEPVRMDRIGEVGGNDERRYSKNGLKAGLS